MRSKNIDLPVAGFWSVLMMILLVLTVPPTPTPTIPPFLSFNGTVTSFTTDLPLPNVTIRIFDSSGAQVAAGTSDANGTFLLNSSNTTGGDYLLLFGMDGQVGRTFYGAAPGLNRMGELSLERGSP